MNFARRRRGVLIFGFGSLAVLTIAFCTGLSVAGTPSIQRRVEADKRRVEDLRQSASDVYSWHIRPNNRQHTEVLPLRLTEVVGAENKRTVDPETRRPYEYVAGAGMQYQLCAVFAASNADELPTPVFWRHETGRTCFTFDAGQVPPWP